VYEGLPVLVTGATGFIGRAVTHRLGKAGARLTLAVRTRSDSAERIAEGTGGRLAVWSAIDPESVMSLVRDAEPAVIFNMAGYGVAPSERDPDLARAINAELPPLLARAMAGQASDGWVGARVIHAGSALEYGVATGTLDETTPARPTTLYGTTKLSGTLELAQQLDRTGQVGLTARLFTVYGPGEREGRLLPSLLACARSGRELELSEGRQRRDFTYVDDVAEGLLRAGALSATGSDTPVRIVNLATGRLASVREFGDIAARVLELDARLLRWGILPTRPEEMAHDPVSTRLLERLTGWVPETSIEDGIRATADSTAGGTGQAPG
jgi:nucleoside-diphosphate-sugar epimerase